MLRYLSHNTYVVLCVRYFLRFFLPFVLCSTSFGPEISENSPLVKASLATSEICFQRSEPSLVPPYHLDTTTMTFSHLDNSRSRESRSPLPLSPPSFCPHATRSTPLFFSLDLYAYMQCVARFRLDNEAKCSRNAGSNAASFSSVACAWNIDLRSRIRSEAKTSRGHPSKYRSARGSSMKSFDSYL